MTSTGDVTALLAAAKAGDRAAFDRVVALIYQELRSAAHQQLARARPSETLNTTALVSELYLKLADSSVTHFADRRHFVAVAATAMRQIILDYVRERGAAKRGGGQTPVSLAEDLQIVLGDGPDLLALDEALRKLGQLNPRLEQVVELRYFGGLSVEETAEAMDSSPRTVKRDWQKARAFLYREMGGPDVLGG
ncbi:MAG: ECF-type sigma factor [Gemmatimonadaceae bacterium]